MWLPFEKIVNQKLAARSMKLRQHLFADSINKHNRQAVDKSKIFTDEVVAVQVFDAAPPEFKRALKLIWGTEVPSSTAAPLTVFTNGHWTPRRSLSAKIPIVLWHAIGTHSWPKMVELLKRMEGEWNMKCIFGLGFWVRQTSNNRS